jgi:DDE superfamily endonuclease
VLDVKGGISAYGESVQPERPEWEGTGRPSKPRYREAPSSLKELALAAGKQAAQTVTWREGTRGSMTSRFLAVKVRPAKIQMRNNANRNGEEIPVCWLLVEWQRARSSRPSTGSPTSRPTLACR